MFTVGIHVKKTETELIIKWQLAKFNIPLEDIIEVIEDDTYGGKEAGAIRIGPPYGTTDRILVKTKKQDYIIFTTNKLTILKEISL
ncbi:MAG TPA: hypothetical protein VNM45_05885 [Bacillus sp. (in: firmicutes)]|nr:hypothetical protein [Bacillus sp. (in: firmicutes)]